jgi:acyl-CoA synthetase (AMP-forming)/AMP-acid ligase II
MNIFPAEIEDVLCARVGVEDAAVIGLPDSKWGEVVCAVVQPTPGAELDADELIEHCYGHLAGFKKPSLVHLVEEIPRTAGGKARKFLLRELLADS